MKDWTFFGLSLIAHSTLALVVSAEANVSDDRLGYCLGHFLLAAILNALLLRIIRRRSLSLLGSPALAFVLISQLYFTMSAIKYLEPFPLYSMFDLDYRERFVGTLVGFGSLLTAHVLLAAAPQPKLENLRDFFDRNSLSIARTLAVTLILDLLIKAYLFSIGFGSGYADAGLTVRETRNPIELFAIFADAYIGPFVFILAGGLLLQRHLRIGKGYTLLAAAVVVLLPVLLITLFKARILILIFAVLILFCLQLRSARAAQGALQGLFIAGPMVAVFGVFIATIAMGRDFREFGVQPSLSFNAGLVGWRTDLTDFGFALMKKSDGAALDPLIVPQALLNSVPAALWVGKDEALEDRYTASLNRLGWPAGLGENEVVDYNDNAMSSMAMSFGAGGMFLGFPLYALWLSILTWMVQSGLRGGLGSVLLVFLGIIGMRTEIDWSAMFLYARDFVLFSVLFAGLYLNARRFPVEFFFGRRFAPN